MKPDPQQPTEADRERDTHTDTDAAPLDDVEPAPEVTDVERENDVA